MSSELLDAPSEVLSHTALVDDFVNDLPIGVYRASPHGEILSANKTLLKIFEADSLEELNATFDGRLSACLSTS